MKKYWGETEDSHLRLWTSDVYLQYAPVKHTITEEGYRGDKLQSTDALFLGTCDVMSSLPDSNLRWSALVHKEKFSDQPFIPLGTVGSGLHAMVRRLYSFIQNHGAPKYVYMTVPRFDGYEYVNKSGKTYSVSSRKGTAKFLKYANLINEEDLSIWLSQIEANKNLENIHNNQYVLEERFSFIELLCKAHNIELKWSFNPSDAGIVLLHRNLAIFEHLSPFMKDSFAGLVEIKDQEKDRSIGIETHRAIYQQFINPESWNYATLRTRAEYNLEWLKTRYGDNLINRE